MVSYWATAPGADSCSRVNRPSSCVGSLSFQVKVTNCPTLMLSNELVKLPPTKAETVETKAVKAAMAIAAIDLTILNLMRR